MSFTEWSLRGVRPSSWHTAAARGGDTAGDQQPARGKGSGVGEKEKAEACQQVPQEGSCSLFAEGDQREKSMLSGCALSWRVAAKPGLEARQGEAELPREGGEVAGSLLGWDCPCGLRDITDTWPSRQHPPGSLPVPREPELRGGSMRRSGALALLEADGEGGVRGTVDYQLSGEACRQGEKPSCAWLCSESQPGSWDAVGHLDLSVLPAGS